MERERMTAADMAAYLNKSISTVKSYMRGSMPDLPTLRDMSRKLRCSLNDLLTPEELDALGVSPQEAKVSA